MQIRKHTIVLPDILIAAWLLFIVIQLSLQGTITVSASFHCLLFVSCYCTGRLIDRIDIVEKIGAVILIPAAAICLFYAVYDSTVFLYPTVASQNSSVLAIETAIAASACFAIVQKQRSVIIQLALGIAACIFIFLIFLLESRTAFIALTGGAFYSCYRKLKHWHVRNRLFLFSGILISMTMVLALVIKVDSSAGRWFIWKNSWRLFQQHWLTGVGTGLFNPSYNHLQADYFFRHTLYGKEAMLADNGYYAFNEWLHVGVEQGIIGLFLFLSLTFFLLKASWKRIVEDDPLPGAVLIAICIASCFSYPLHNWLVLSTAAFFAGIICRGAHVVWYLYAPRWPVRAFWVTLIGIVCITGMYNWHSFAGFRKARDLAEEGAKTEAYTVAKNQAAALKTNPSFSLFYLQLLYETDRLQEAITWFNTLHAFHCSHRVHALAGKCYAETGAVEPAKKHLLMSLYIKPNLMQTRMDLLHFYDKQGDTTQARFWANEIIHHAPKINSPRADLLKREAARYITKSNAPY